MIRAVPFVSRRRVVALHRELGEVLPHLPLADVEGARAVMECLAVVLERWDTAQRVYRTAVRDLCWCAAAALERAGELVPVEITTEVEATERTAPARGAS